MCAESSAKTGNTERIESAKGLAAAEGPWDMLSLKSALNCAEAGASLLASMSRWAFQDGKWPTWVVHFKQLCGLDAGTGEVRNIIKSIAFEPQAAAFTAILHMCGKSKSWLKALDVLEAMKVHHPDCINTFHYSSVISTACKCGQLKEAFKVGWITASLCNLQSSIVILCQHGPR